jgi:hypothetical protein
MSTKDEQSTKQFDKAKEKVRSQINEFKSSSAAHE